jgi:hypothetical protein
MHQSDGQRERYLNREGELTDHQAHSSIRFLLDPTRSIIAHGMNLWTRTVFAIVYPYFFPGDLFYSEHDVMEPTAWLAGAVDGRGLHYRNKVLCIADYIVPGHGKLFRVSEMMRPSKLHCDSLLANLD